MWARWQLKENAKAVLRKSYWKAFLVSFILTLVTNGNHFSKNIGGDSPSYVPKGDFSVLAPFLPFIIGAAFTVFAVSLLISIFVSGTLEVGATRYFLESTQMRFNLGDIVFGFSCGRYINVVITMLLRWVYTFLWSLLLVIPGIIKSYSYSMVPFILAENPGIPAGRAIQLSCDITSGHKWEMFVLDLSFFGWYLLGALAFGIGVLFVSPYYHATKAQLYLALRAIALDRQIVTLQELEGYR